MRRWPRSLGTGLFGWRRSHQVSLSLRTAGDSQPRCRGDGGWLSVWASPSVPLSVGTVLCLCEGTSVVGAKVMGAELPPVPVCAYVTCISQDSKTCPPARRSFCSHPPTRTHGVGTDLRASQGGHRVFLPPPAPHHPAAAPSPAPGDSFQKAPGPWGVGEFPGPDTPRGHPPAPGLSSEEPGSRLGADSPTPPS